MIPIDSVDLANVLITATILDPTDRSTIRAWTVLRCVECSTANEALVAVADICGRDVAEALMEAVEEERMRATETPSGPKGVEFAE